MSDHFQKKSRKSIRLPEYDYAQNGYYFVTICCRQKKCLFGKIKGGEMKLNFAGEIIEKWWKKIPEKFDEVRLGKFVVMPNHFHGIIIIENTKVGAIPCNRPNKSMGAIPCNRPNKSGENAVSPLRDTNKKQKIPNTYDGLGSYIAWFKKMAINEYIREVKKGNLPPFEKSIWQRNYHEHVIRSDDALEKISDYIQYNPILWEKDKYFQ